jgi:small subunit ribosomal protein S1
MTDPDKLPSQPKYVPPAPKVEEQPKAEPEPKPEPAPKAEAQPKAESPLPGRRFGKHNPRMPQKEEPIQQLPEVEEQRGHVSLRQLDELIEREMQEAMGDFAGKDVMGGDARGKSGAKPGSGQQQKKARVMAIRGNDIFLDIPGGRSQGVIPTDQFPEGLPEVGAEVDVHIEGYDNANGLLILSRQGAAVHVDWSSVTEGMIVEARVTANNKGGLSVEVNGIRGFMPISQIDLYRVETPEQFLNQRLKCIVTEARPEERNLVVSRRALLEKEREEQREKTWNELAEGQIREGVVRSIKEFGAFVDLGGVDGLLHLSEMSWQRVQKPEDVVQPGQTVRVVVLKIDRETRKVGLGLRQLQASPWDAIDANYPPKTVVKGKVTRVTEFGAFVEVEPGIEGLVHVSELATHRVRRVTDIAKIGQEVNVMVLATDKAQRRMSLSIKAAEAAAAPPPQPEPEPEPEEPAKPVKPPRPRTTPLRGGTGDGRPLFG